MRTTNTKSESDPKTYANMREECDKLLKLAEKLEQISSENPDNFLYDSQFRKLKDEYKAVFEGMS